MNDNEPVNGSEDVSEPVEELEPQPMKAKPVLQTMSWIAGVAAGGLLAFVLVMKPSHARGATKACHAAWQLRQSKPAQVADQRALAPREMDESPQTAKGIGPNSSRQTIQEQGEGGHECRGVYPSSQ
jgi:hypothetical protein